MQLSRVNGLLIQQNTSTSRLGLDDLLDGRSMERDERECSELKALWNVEWNGNGTLANGHHRDAERGDDARGERMRSLLDTVDELGEAMESQVVSVVYNSDCEME
ncbi:hypothetical protein PENTCL1PPCAC_19304, partial [Pristionchus entomophagus]